ncbi:MAG TPA: 3-hydroxyacyl-CoA dehydrogenase family protein [Candidatus Thermoplasmatota archaeon]|jgi:3-hydroxybutyryl-CoA dehydrogenase|nr:3-hydroxyacyl-CoA dehydrogenase family protein [Candidatus Thermoplasmatota archaeon]
MVLFVQKVGVVGAGTMGAAIAEVLALNGKKVVLKDLNKEVVERGLRHVDKLLDELVQFHASKAQGEIARIEDLGIKLTAEQQARVREARKPTYTRERADRVRASIQGSVDNKDLADCDLIIEAVFEDLEVKKKVFRELDEATPRHVVLASNTSGLSITAIAAATKRPKKVIGLHFFNPPTMLPLVEVIPGMETDESTVEDVLGLLQELRNHRFPMQPVRVKEIPGFVVNRILGRMLWEAYALMEEGIASPRDIDLAMKAGAGMPMGPFELSDLIGIDVIWHLTNHLKESGFETTKPVRVVDQLYHAGRFGKKSGRGFYEYEA